MTRDFPTCEADFRASWSMAAGASTALEGACMLVEARAQRAYIQHKDQVATALRDAATELRAKQKEASAELHAFIEEDKRRTFEKRKLAMR